MSAALVRTRLPQVAALIPPLGYAVLWGDQAQTLIMRYDMAFGVGGAFSPMARVQLLYFGSVVILAGVVSFWVMCPRPIRAPSKHAYLAAVEHVDSAMEGLAAAEYLRRNFQPIGDGSLFLVHGVTFSASHLSMVSRGQQGFGIYTSVMSAYYEARDRSRPLWSFFSFVTMSVGAAIFLLPSVEVFFLALLHLLT